MRARSGLFLSVVGVSAILILAGCAGKSERQARPDEEQGLTLEYEMKEGAPLTYVFTSDFNQSMEIEGRDVPITSVQVLTFSVLPAGMEGTDYSIGVTIDDMALTIESPEGSVDTDVSGVIGGSFDMTLSASGQEGNLPDPEILTFSAGPEGSKSIVPAFSSMFPDMPDRPVEVGDTWPTEVNVDESEGEGTSSLRLDMINTLDGFETVDGRDCARITTTFTGMIIGDGVEHGAHWSMESDTEGTGVCYFDFKNGVLVSDSSTGTADGTLTVTTPSGEMVIPIARTYTMVSKLTQ